MKPKIRVSKTTVSTIFHMPSFTRVGKTYAVRFVRKRGMQRWSCTCGSYYWRQSILNRGCKHVRAIKELVKLAGGVRKLADHLIAYSGGQ